MVAVVVATTVGVAHVEEDQGVAPRDSRFKTAREKTRRRAHLRGREMARLTVADVEDPHGETSTVGTGVAPRGITQRFVLQ